MTLEERKLLLIPLIVAGIVTAIIGGGLVLAQSRPAPQAAAPEPPRRTPPPESCAQRCQRENNECFDQTRGQDMAAAFRTMAACNDACFSCFHGCGLSPRFCRVY